MAGRETLILLDTHSLIWLAGEPDKLSRNATEAIQTADHQGGLGIAAITLWELAWLAAHGRVDFTGTMEAFVARLTSRTSIRPLTVQVATLAQQLPPGYPTDPSDRLIGATALAEGIPLVTKDRKIRACRQIKTIW